MSVIALQIGTLWWREITRFRRQRSRLIGAFVQPLVFWALLGAGLSASFRPRGMAAQTGYAEYVYPGMIVLVLLFTAIFSTIQTIEDRKEGFLQGVLVAPIARHTVVLGQAAGASTMAMIQGIIFLALAPVAGIPLNAAAAAATIVVMAFIAFALTNIGLAIAWRIESTQGFHAIMNLILLPLWLLSGAFFPATGAPAWLQWTMRLNPLSYGMAALRESVYLAHPQARGGALPAFTLSIVITIVFAACAFALAAGVARRSATSQAA